MVSAAFAVATRENISCCIQNIANIVTRTCNHVVDSPAFTSALSALLATGGLRWRARTGVEYKGQTVEPNKKNNHRQRVVEYQTLIDDLSNYVN